MRSASTRILLVLDVVLATSHSEAGQGCAADTDCSLNGLCQNSICVCDSGWRGVKCQTLDLVPGQRKSGYRIVEDPVRGNVSSWGGGGWYDKRDGKWYMWGSEMDGHCGMQTWTSNSQTFRASSKSGLGLYKREAVQFPRWSHESEVTRGPNGEYLAFFTFNATPGDARKACTLCTNGSTPFECHAHGLQVGISNTDPTYMSWSLTATGNWSTPVLVLDSTIVPSMIPMDTNMGGVILKNGSFVGMWRDHVAGSRGNIGHSVPHLVTASDWRDPRTYSFDQSDLLFSNRQEGNPGGVEDMFLWVDARDHFHALFHQQYQPKNSTSHAYSVDGRSWTYTWEAADAVAEYADGSHDIFNGCERPHLIFDKDGVTPIALTNGAAWEENKGWSGFDQSITLLRPLRRKAKEEILHF